MNIPSDWNLCPIGDRLTLQRGFDITKAQQREGGVPVVSSGGIGSFHDTAAVAGPGVVIGRKGTLGKVFFIESDYWPHDTTLWVKDFKGNEPRFVYYFFRNLGLERHDVGSSNPTLNRNHVHPIVAPWPAVADQRAIAEVLGALDDKITLNKKICSTSLMLADSYYRLAGESDEEAVIVQMAQLAVEGLLEFGDGYRTKRTEHGQPGIPILRVAEVGDDGDIRPAFVDYVRDEYRSVMKGKTSKVGDVVLTTKGTVGRVALIASESHQFVYSPQICYFRFKDNADLSNFYFFHWVRGPEFWRQAIRMKGRTDMADYLSLGDIKSLRITVPSRESLAAFNGRSAPLHARIAAARSENRTLADLRDTLLPQLLSGKIRVKDAVRTVEEAV